MADRFGSYTPTTLGGYARQQQAQQAPQDRTLNGRETAIRPLELRGIKERQAAEQQNELTQQKLDYLSPGQTQQRASDVNEEGDVVIGRIGQNHPRDSRMAQVLAALGIETDLMKAIVASSKLRESDNR